MIGYPWGSFNHAVKMGRNYLSKESPDFRSIDSLGQMLLNQAGNDIQIHNSRIPKYTLGDISSTIYPVKGGLEDWAYGAGWDNSTSGGKSTLYQCLPYTY